MFEVALRLNLVFTDLLTEHLVDFTEVAHVNTTAVEEVLHALRVGGYTITWLKIINKWLELIFLQEASDVFNQGFVGLDFLGGHGELDWGLEDVGVEFEFGSFL